MTPSSEPIHEPVKAPPRLDFAIVGQPKSGTTALAQFLSEHPQIAFSVPKESAYFATDFHRESDAFHGRQVYFNYRTPQDFKALFEHADEGQLLGEGSTSSLYSVEAAQNLHAHNPEMKIIAMFRDPVAMIHALHTQYVNETVEDLDFEAAIAAEDERAAGRMVPSRVRSPSYVLYGRRTAYTDQLRRFEDLFGPRQILNVLSEEFRDDNAGTFASVAGFLGIDPEFQPDFRTVHGSQTARSGFLNRALNQPRFKNRLSSWLGPRRYTALRDRVAGAVFKSSSRPEIDPTLDAALRKRFKAEVVRFGEHIGRDLSTIWHGYV
ncbi:MAG: hypothetical protein HKN91_10685 [Acidimicrobiia bacterium]|nr:hypothetical protein [Acidimicrobiia bacterium]